MRHMPQLVAVEIEVEIRSAIRNLINSRNVLHNRGLTPDEVQEWFDALLADIAVEHGWIADCDGRWFRPLAGRPAVAPRQAGEENKG